MKREAICSLSLLQNFCLSLLVISGGEACASSSANKTPDSQPSNPLANSLRIPHLRSYTLTPTPPSSSVPRLSPREVVWRSEKGGVPRWHRTGRVAVPRILPQSVQLAMERERDAKESGAKRTQFEKISKKVVAGIQEQLEVGMPFVIYHKRFVYSPEELRAVAGSFMKEEVFSRFQEMFLNNIRKNNHPNPKIKTALIKAYDTYGEMQRKVHNQFLCSILTPWKDRMAADLMLTQAIQQYGRESQEANFKRDAVSETTHKLDKIYRESVEWQSTGLSECTKKLESAVKEALEKEGSLLEKSLHIICEVVDGESRAAQLRELWGRGRSISPLPPLPIAPRPQRHKRQTSFEICQGFVEGLKEEAIKSAAVSSPKMPKKIMEETLEMEGVPQRRSPRVTVSESPAELIICIDPPAIVAKK